MSKNMLLSEVAALTPAVINMTNALPENTYWSLSAYTMLLPHILKELGQTLPPQAPAIVGPLWNYIDAACNLLTGLAQLADTGNHRPHTNRSKGLVNIASGAQLIALTAFNFTHLGGIGFAAAFGASFINSLDDVVRSTRRYTDSGYWLKDNLGQIIALQKQKTALEAEIRHLETNEGKPSKVSAWLLKQKASRLHSLQKNLHELQIEVKYYIAAMRHGIQEPADLAEILKNLDPEFINSDYGREISKINSINMESLEKLYPKVAAEAFHEEISRKGKEDIITALKESIRTGTAFTGLLLCVIPGCQLPGLIVMGLASSLYMAKYGAKITNSAFHFFNKKSKNTSKDEIEILSPIGFEFPEIPEQPYYYHPTK